VSQKHHGARDAVSQLLGNGHLGGHRSIILVLVHGDLWTGNGTIASWGAGVEEVVFDPSACWARSEYELGVMRMFGGFSAGFFHDYHRLVPKTEPVGEYEPQRTD
jgi:fructosamine-3-kinase